MEGKESKIQRRRGCEMIVYVGSDGIEKAILSLRRKVQSSSIQKELRFKGIAKRSERLKAKRQLAEAKRKRRQMNVDNYSKLLE